MKEVFEEISISPKFTYIVVSKRINTRFFRVNGGAPGNPPSGTIVDDVVTLPERYDFFLISQVGFLGFFFLLSGGRIR